MVIVLKKEIIINNLDEMYNLGNQIGRLVKPNMVITLTGNLGVGKTTLTKAIAKGLGITKVVNSPTFTILKIYLGRLTLNHLDVYRIKGDDDFELEEYFYNGGVSVIEWGENISQLLPQKTLDIRILNLGGSSRQVILTGIDEYKDLIAEVVL